VEIRSIGAVIAERELDGVEDGKPCKVIVRLGIPFKESDGWWICPYSIGSLGGERLRYGAGLDSLQALTLATSMVGAELNALYSDLKLQWAGERDLGFPPKV
jgi:hypothetical protein